MTIQNQGIEEVKASFGVNAEVADAIDKKAVAPGKVQKNGDQESESIPQGSSLPKTKISMINAVMSKLSEMDKEDVEQQLASMEEAELDEDQFDEAHRRGGNMFPTKREKDAIQKKMKPLDPNAPVEYKDNYKGQKYGLPHEEQLKRHIHAATGHHVYISPFTHDMHPHDSKEVITKEVYNTGGKGTYGGPGGTKHTPNSLVQAVKKFHNKKLRAEEVEEDELDEADGPGARWRQGKPLLRSRSVSDPRHPAAISAQAKYPDEKRTYVLRGYDDDQKEPVQRAGRDNPDPLAGRGAIASKSKGTAKTNRALKQAMKDNMKKITQEDINVSEDIAAAFSGSDLSEEFKAQATEIFETAVVSAVNMKLAEMAEQAEEEYAEEMQSIEEGLTTKIDEYLDYVVEQWMEENKLAVESGLRSEVTENFLSGLRNLFAENWIDIPEEKVEVVEELAGEVEHLTASLDEEMQKNIELKKQVERFEREIAFVDVSEGLTEMQIAKFESLAEAVDYENAESYKEKLETIRTSFFESRSEEVTESRTSLDEEFIETNETSEKKLEPNMQVYSAAISRSVKK